MARYTGEVASAHAPEEVWRYLADLRSVRQWDPSIKAARLVAGTPGSVGARYELEVGFLGRTTTLEYETVEAEPPERVVFVADTGSVTIRDEARVAPGEGGGSRATWDARAQLAGARRVLDPAFGLAFGRLGRAAERGLAERLREPALEPPGDGTAP